MMAETAGAANEFLSAVQRHHPPAVPNGGRPALFNTARRRSDVCALNCSNSNRYNNNNNDNNNLTTFKTIDSPSVSLQRTSSDRRSALPSSLTSPSIASSALVGPNNGIVATSSQTIGVGTGAAAMLASKRRRCSRVINFGYACAIYYLDEPPEMDGDEDEEENEYEEEEEQGIGMLSCQTVEHRGRLMEEDNVQLIDDISTHCGAFDENNQQQQERLCEKDTFCHRSSTQESDYALKHQTRRDTHSQLLLNDASPSSLAGELFLLRHRNEEIPHYCIRPQGMEADRFIQQSLSEKNRSEIKKFLERNAAPEDGDWSYLWISNDLKLEDCPVFIFSIKMLENFFKNERIRRVKWRHLSVDKISVYRYSLPQITTKFRLRIAHFLVRHYRCCILCVWLLIILCISIGIIFSVMFGSAPTGSSKMNATYMGSDDDGDASSPRHHQGHRGGRFMADELVEEEGEEEEGGGGVGVDDEQQQHHQQQQQQQRQQQQQQPHHHQHQRKQQQKARHFEDQQQQQQRHHQLIMMSR